MLTQLDETFSSLLVAKQIVISSTDEAAIQAAYMQLYRRFAIYTKELDKCGFLRDEFQNATVGISISRAEYSTEVRATISIKKKREAPQFTIISIGLPHDSQVSTDLEHNQDSQIQHGSGNSHSQEQRNSADTSSAEGESTGQCDTEEDWRAVVRKFIEQDDSLPKAS